MKLGLTLVNCFWLIIPLLAWNLLLGPRITQIAILSDAHSPKWLLIAENITRILVFALPLIIPLQIRDSWGKTGLLVYILGTLVYFASWLPLILGPGFSLEHQPGRPAGSAPDSFPVLPGYCIDRESLALRAVGSSLHIHAYLAWGE